MIYSVEYKYRKINVMKKSTWIIIGAIAAVIVLFMWTTYNGLATAQLDVAAKWSNVETQYQRRADLIPNLVNTVKGYASHEQKTLEDVVKARTAATSVNVDADNMTPEQFRSYVSAQNGVTSALGRLIAISENYPDLKANQNFLELQAQLEGTENRIAVARNEYNETVKRFNVKTATFPSNIVAGMFGFSQKEFFSASEGAATVPVVEF